MEILAPRVIELTNEEVALHNELFRYRVKEGVRAGEHVPSPSILAKYITSPKMDSYKMKNSYNAQVKKLKQTGDLGIELHELIRLDLLGKPASPPIDLYEAFKNWEEIKRRHQISLYHEAWVEIPVYSEKLGLGGRLDMFGYFTACEDAECCSYVDKEKYQGRLCVMDIKSGYYGDKVGPQLACYAEAAQEQLGIDGVGTVGIQVHRDGTRARCFPTSHIAWHLKTLCAWLEVYKAVNFYKLDKEKWPWLHECAFDRYQQAKEKQHELG